MPDDKVKLPESPVLFESPDDNRNRPLLPSQLDSPDSSVNDPELPARVDLPEDKVNEPDAAVASPDSNKNAPELLPSSVLVLKAPVVEPVLSFPVVKLMGPPASQHTRRQVMLRVLIDERLALLNHGLQRIASSQCKQIVKPHHLLLRG